MSVLKAIIDALGPARDLLLGVLLGTLVSLLIAENYFQRQRKLDKEKEKAAVLLQFLKLTNVYKRWHLEKLGREEEGAFPIYVKDAMAEYATVYDLYLPNGDHTQGYKQALETAQKEIIEHPERFVLKNEIGNRQS